MNPLEELENNQSAILVFINKDNGIFIEHYILYPFDDPEDQLFLVATELYHDNTYGLAGRTDLQFITFKGGEEYTDFKKMIKEMINGK
jgi:hypothetical protein